MSTNENIPTLKSNSIDFRVLLLDILSFRINQYNILIEGVFYLIIISHR